MAEKVSEGVFHSAVDSVELDVNSRLNWGEADGGKEEACKPDAVLKFSRSQTLRCFSKSRIYCGYNLPDPKPDIVFRPTNTTTKSASVSCLNLGFLLIHKGSRLT